MKRFFHYFHKAQTDPDINDCYDPLDACASEMAAPAPENRVSIQERMQSFAPLVSELFRHKTKPLLWPY